MSAELIIIENFFSHDYVHRFRIMHRSLFVKSLLRMYGPGARHLHCLCRIHPSPTRAFLAYFKKMPGVIDNSTSIHVFQWNHGHRKINISESQSTGNYCMIPTELQQMLLLTGMDTDVLLSNYQSLSNETLFIHPITRKLANLLSW